MNVKRFSCKKKNTKKNLQRQAGVEGFPLGPPKSPGPLMVASMNSKQTTTRRPWPFSDPKPISLGCFGDCKIQNYPGP